MRSDMEGNLSIMAPTGWLVPSLLLAIRECYHGHELAEILSALGFDGMRPGADTYLALWAMEEDGLILPAGVGEGFDLPWRGYEVTESGEAHLDLWMDALERYREQMDLFLGIYAEHPGG